MGLTTEDLKAIEALFDRKFEVMDRRLTKLEHLAEQMDKRLTRLEQLTEQIDKRLTNQEQCVEQLRVDMDSVCSTVTRLEAEVADLNKRVGALERLTAQLDKRMSHVEQDLKYEAVPRLKTIESCYTDTFDRYRRDADRMEQALTQIDVVRDAVGLHSRKFQEISKACDLPQA